MFEIKRFQLPRAMCFLLSFNMCWHLRILPVWKETICANFELSHSNQKHIFTTHFQNVGAVDGQTANRPDVQKSPLLASFDDLTIVAREVSSMTLKCVRSCTTSMLKCSIAHAKVFHQENSAVHVHCNSGDECQNPVERTNHIKTVPTSNQCQPGKNTEGPRSRFKTTDLR